MITHTCANVVFGVLFALAGLVLAGLPLAVWFYYDQNKDTIEPHTLGWLISSVVVGVTLPISVWEIVMHLRYMEVPLLQVPIIRILWMVPIYAVDSWLALRFPPPSLSSRIKRFLVLMAGWNPQVFVDGVQNALAVHQHSSRVLRGKHPPSCLPGTNTGSSAPSRALHPRAVSGADLTHASSRPLSSTTFSSSSRASSRSLLSR